MANVSATVHNKNEKRNQPSSAAHRFIVYRRVTGGEYLVERAKKNATGPRYRWSKAGLNKAIIYKDRRSAERTAKKYGGQVLECV